MKKVELRTPIKKRIEEKQIFGGNNLKQKVKDFPSIERIQFDKKKKTYFSEIGEMSGLCEKQKSNIKKEMQFLKKSIILKKKQINMLMKKKSDLQMMLFEMKQNRIKIFESINSSKKIEQIYFLTVKIFNDQEEFKRKGQKKLNILGEEKKKTDEQIRELKRSQQNSKISISTMKKQIKQIEKIAKLKQYKQNLRVLQKIQNEKFEKYLQKFIENYFEVRIIEEKKRIWNVFTKKTFENTFKIAKNKQITNILNEVDAVCEIFMILCTIEHEDLKEIKISEHYSQKMLQIFKFENFSNIIKNYYYQTQYKKLKFNMNKEREISLICEEKDIMLMKKIRESLEKYISIRFAFKEVLNYSFIA